VNVRICSQTLGSVISSSPPSYAQSGCSILTTNSYYYLDLLGSKKPSSRHLLVLGGVVNRFSRDTVLQDLVVVVVVAFAFAFGSGKWSRRAVAVAPMVVVVFIIIFLLELQESVVAVVAVVASS
jgi:hypothetical protein